MSYLKMQTTVRIPLRKGTLTKFGYSTKNTKRSRHIALAKAARNIGKTSVLRKLNAVAILSKNTNKPVSLKYIRDYKWLHDFKL